MNSFLDDIWQKKIGSEYIQRERESGGRDLLLMMITKRIGEHCKIDTLLQLGSSKT